MTGMELHRELREPDAELAERVVFMTGGAFTPSARSFLDEVANPRLEKPFDVQQLVGIVNERLRPADA
jgi:FixJ family two-component response regulator